MTKIRKRLNKEESDLLGLENWYKNEHGNRTYVITPKQWEIVQEFRKTGVSVASTSDTPLYEKNFIMSAWSDEGFMMDIDLYCEHYNLPREDVKSYKLVTHTGTPFYNIVFKENAIEEVLDYDFIESTVRDHIKPIKVTPEVRFRNSFDRVVYTDAHIGMDPNKRGDSMYKSKWDAEELGNRRDEMVQFILSQRDGDTLVVDDLGDSVDGWSGETARGGHKLPQNMTNKEMFKEAVNFKVTMIDALAPFYSQIVCNNICNDNHSGNGFGSIVNEAFRQIVELKYDHVSVTNHEQFINHYFMGKFCFVISHGKDSNNLKFGFKPQLDPKQIEKIDQYLKHYDIFKVTKDIEFGKGDSHQLILDYTTSNDFHYFNFQAFSPSSEWIETNYKLNPGGFVLQHVGDIKVIKPYFFK